MGRKRKTLPAMTLHRPSNRARVRIDGQDVYLGPWRSEEAEEAYRRICAEILATPVPPSEPRLLLGGPTVQEIILGYAEHRTAQTGRKITDNERLALKALREQYGRIGAAQFGPLKLIALRRSLIDGACLSRGEINRRIAIIKRAFKWAASMELVDGKVWHGLSAVENLKRGHVGTRETEPVAPVSDDVVEATCRELHPLMAALVRFARLTGCRIGEACSLTPGEIDRRGETWVYRPGRHKSCHLGKPKAIPIGPKARAILAPHLEGIGPGDIVFSPERAMALRAAESRAKRKTKVQPSQRGQRTGRPGPRAYSRQYDHRSVRHAILRACERAGVPRWHVHQLRHACATEIRARFGIEAARAVLGHSTVSMTAHYAEIDEAKAIRAISEIG